MRVEDVSQHRPGVTVATHTCPPREAGAKVKPVDPEPVDEGRKEERDGYEEDRCGGGLWG